MKNVTFQAVERAQVMSTLILCTDLMIAEDDARKSTIAIMAPPGQHYVEGTWGTWLSGGIAVPMCLTHPAR